MLASSFSTRFLLRKNRRSRLPAPLGPLFCRPRHGCAAPGPQRQNPGPPRFQLGFCCAKIGAAGYRPHLLGLPRKSARGISLRETTLCGCPLRGHGFATPHRCFAVPVTAPPRRVPNGKTPALAPIRSHFACGETAQPVIGPTGADVLPSPSRLCRAGSPTAKPRRLLPFGRISPAAKPRSRSSAPPGPMFWPAPLSLCSSAVPRPKPRRLLPFGRISPAAKPRGRSLPPPGATCSLPHFRSAQMWPRARTPALLVFNSVFAARKPAGASPPLSDGGALTKPENIILCASSCHPPRSPYPHCTLPHVRFSGIGQKKKPQRKTAAAVNTLYMSCKKTSVNPISFPVALCTKISPFKAIHLLSQCKTKIQFLWMRMRKRSAN